jgi:hypothetical protein
MTESELLDYINSKIKQNGKRAITGDVLNLALRSLLELIDGGTTVDWGDIEGTLSDQTDLQTALNNKVDKEAGNRLITSTEISKLSGIQAGAEVNVNADWDATSGDAQILNKPTIPNPANFVAKADYTPAHSVLAQQSGTGSPSSVTIGNNQILGRLSGGGSNIKGLSVSEVKTLLDLDGENTGDETQASILSKLGFVNKQQFGGTVSGTISETIVHTYAFSANELNANEILHFETQFFRVGALANGIFRLRFNTSNTLVGATLLATTSMGGNTTTFASMRRKLTISGGNIIGLSPSSSNTTDFTSSTLATLSSAIDVTQALWFFVTYQPSGSGDTATCSFSHLKNF